MKNRIWYSPLGRAIVLSLVFSAALATQVLADEAVPPAAEGSAGESVAEDTAVSEGAEIAPLASEQASGVSVENDPMWCPVGAAPTGLAPCSPDRTYFNQGGLGLINWLLNDDPSVAGVIWIHQDYDSSDGLGDGAVTLDGGDYTTFDTVSLTLRGGWTGTSAGLINQANTSRFNAGALTVIGWDANVTLTDITVTGSSANMEAVPVSFEPALYVDTTRNVVLTRVRVISNTGFVDTDGAFINNSTGTGTVSITDSQFSNNSLMGLRVWSKGLITLTNVEASGNAFGAHLDNLFGAGNVVLANTTAYRYVFTNLFNGNDLGDGLQVDSLGTVTIKHVIALGNSGGDGVDIDNDGGSVAKFVKVTGSGAFTDNGGAGLRITSDGAVTLNKITASGNFQDGVEIDNDNLSTSASTVTLTGFGNFSGNGSDGLDVESFGVITLNNISATNNINRGVLLDNDSGSFSSAIAVLGFLNASDNGSFGLQVNSDGAITIANLTASRNDGGGAVLDNHLATLPKAVTLSGTNNLDNNVQTGLLVSSLGLIKINNLSANWNGRTGIDGSSGVVLYNTAASGTQQGVTLTGTSSFQHNAFNGLQIDSYGVVMLNNLTANENGKYLSNFAGSGVQIKNTGGLVAAKAVTLTGINGFSDNDHSGLVIITQGAVTLNNLTADHNGDDGVAVDDPADLLIAGPVRVNGVNVFSSNGEDGLFVQSLGAITVSKATARDNGLYGLYLLNNFGASTAPVALAGYLTSVSNGRAGLYVLSFGTIAAANLTTGGNAWEGTRLSNYGAASPKPVTITGYNLFQDNGMSGLDIDSTGAVTVSNVTAIYNGASADSPGVSIGNDKDAAFPHNVTLIGPAVFNHNGRHGLDVFSYGSVTLGNVTASDNGRFISDTTGSGVRIQNNGGLLPKAVLITGTNNFQWNDALGLEVYSQGAITLSNVTAFNNDLTGVLLDNDEGTAQSNVLISGYGAFNENGDDGLAVFSQGSVTTNNLTALNNTDYGLYLDVDTSGTTAPRAVTLNGFNTVVENGTSDTDTGLWVQTDGNIKVSNLTASYNQGTGARLDNDSTLHAPVGTATITGFGDFTGNVLGRGLAVYSKGTVTLNYIMSNLNGDAALDYGIEIHTDGPVTLVCSLAYGNLDAGLFVDGTAAPNPTSLTLKGFLAYGNTGPQTEFNGQPGATITITVCP